MNLYFAKMEGMDIWELLAGIGIFLFGMYLLEESIKMLSGKAFKHFIRKYTSSKGLGILSGMLATAVLQSSSAVSLMILAFTGAGIMTTYSAIGVIIGSNLGTTFTAWIVATVGFKLKIEILSLPFIGIGGLVLIFLGNSVKWVNISKFLVGFGFLFMGLDYMKNSVEAMAMGFDMSIFSHLPKIIFLFVGLALTAIVQSSSAAMAIILSSLYSGVIQFDAACMMVIGTNIGTTVTVLIGSIGGTSAKMKVALSHFTFNVTTSVVATSLFPALSYIVSHWFGLENDPVIGLAAFHTLFNLLGVAIFFPFIGLLGKILDKVVKERKVQITSYIHQAPSEIAEAALPAMHNEVIYLLRLSMEHNLRILNIDPTPVLPEIKRADGSTIPLSSLSVAEKYEQIKLLQGKIFNYAASIQAQEMEEDEAKELNRLLHSVRYVVASAKSIKDVSHNIDDMEGSEHPIAQQYYVLLRKQALELYLKLAELFDNTVAEDRLAKLHRYRELLLKRDYEFIQGITKILSTTPLPESELSSLLSSNRGWVSSGRQLIMALKDILLSPQEAALYESLVENDQFIRSDLSE
jgi:phosphate:Na+ symporter